MFYEIPADYKGLLPPHWHDFLEINILDEIINGKVNLLHETIRKGVDNKSVAHADLQGIQRWEKILGLSSPINSTLEARRDAVRAKLMTKPPINLGTLYGIIETYDVLQLSGDRAVIGQKGVATAAVNVKDLIPV